MSTSYQTNPHIDVLRRTRGENVCGYPFVFLEGAEQEESIAWAWREWHSQKPYSSYLHYRRTMMQTPWGKSFWKIPALLDSEGHPVASMSVYELPFRFDDHTITLGGIGCFIVDPKHRGDGLGRKFLEQVNHYFQKQDYQGSVLYSVIDPKFYAKQGYTLCPTYILSTPLSELKTPDTDSSSYTIRPVQDKDWKPLQAIYDYTLSQQRIQLLRNEEYWKVEILRDKLFNQYFPDSSHPRNFVVLERPAGPDGKSLVSSYIRYYTDKEDASLNILEYGALPSMENDLLLLFEEVIRSAGTPIESLIGFLPSSFFETFCHSPGTMLCEKHDMMIKSLSPGFSLPEFKKPEEYFVWNTDKF